MSKEDKLDDDQVKEVVKSLINKTTTYINVNVRDAFYGELQYMASDLGYIKKLEYPYHNEWVLSNNDVSRCVDELWEYVLIGILATDLFPFSNSFL